ncbi:hypothetical protein GQ600_6744 [Phytophthora cactorum]|nr:hypothetical protein GQ600_6744 [Phytophthora cactorum]
MLAIWSNLGTVTISNLQTLRRDNNAELQQQQGDSSIVYSMQVYKRNRRTLHHGDPPFTCLGWHQTGECSPDGPREPDNDASCSTNIKAGASGYCLLKNEATGEEVQVMRVNCSSMRDEIRFNCRQAADFARVAPQIDALIAAKQQEVKQNEDVQLHPRTAC